MVAKHILLISILVEVAISASTSESTTGTVRELVLHRDKRTVGLNPELHQAYLALIQQQTSTGPQNTDGWEEFAPTIPEGNDINCYVEVVTLERRGGRCIRFGRSPLDPAVCQSGMHYDVQDQCESVILQRYFQSRS